MNHPQWLQWVIPSWSFFREPNDGVAEKCWGRGTSSSSIHAGVDATRSCNEFPVSSGCLRHGWHQGWPPPYHYLARRKGCGAQRGTEGALCDMWRCVTKPGLLQPTWQWEDLLHTEPIWPHTPDLLHFRCASLAEDDKELHGEFWFPPSDTAALERWSLHLLDAYLASLSGACWESAVHTMPKVEQGSCWSHFLQSNEGQFGCASPQCHRCRHSRGEVWWPCNRNSQFCETHESILRLLERSKSNRGCSQTQ